MGYIERLQKGIVSDEEFDEEHAKILAGRMITIRCRLKSIQFFSKELSENCILILLDDKGEPKFNVVKMICLDTRENVLFLTHEMQMSIFDEHVQAHELLTVNSNYQYNIIPESSLNSSVRIGYLLKKSSGRFYTV